MKLISKEYDSWEIRKTCENCGYLFEITADDLSWEYNSWLQILFSFSQVYFTCVNCKYKTYLEDSKIPTSVKYHTINGNKNEGT